MEVDIIRAAFKAVGLRTEFVYLPNLRLPVEFSQGSVDCVCANVAYDLAADSGREAHRSDVTIEYQNYVVTLGDEAEVITKLEDMSDMSVLAFNNAVKYLGPEFAAMAENNPQYQELADQQLQVRMLYSRRVNAVVSDKRIFLYWRSKLRESAVGKSLDLTPEVVFHPIFEPAPRNLFFRAEPLRKLFNEGLSLIRKGGVFEAIIDRYVGAEMNG